MKIIVAADFCPRMRVETRMGEDPSFDPFAEVRPIIGEADYSLVNLECPVGCEGSSPVTKCGPHLKCSERAVSLLGEVGFSCATLANNHIRDYGDASLLRTLEVLAEKGLDHVGAGRNLEEAGRVLRKEVGGMTIAVVNCCEHEFSIATDSGAGANPMEAVRTFREIQEAKRTSDFVLLVTHGGMEHYPLPTPRMQELYRFFVDAGASAVVNHHQHCYSGYECYKGAPIFYGLGNFCFDSQRRNSQWNEGYMVRLDFERSGVSFELIPYVQCDESPVVSLMDAEKTGGFESKVRELNRIIEDPSAVKKEFEKFAMEHGSSYMSMFYPYQNSVLVSLAKKRLLPNFLQKRRLVRALNYVDCESHRDLLSLYMNHVYAERD
ncbi:MAG: CapA family protein [Paludibacteraceae bacterium]|nr:CapA family protein [Paludibacteraceae bacterium]